MSAAPQIKEFMTRSPHCVTLQTSLKAARWTFVEHRIHHLPIVDNGAVVGVLTDHDVRALEALTQDSAGNALVTAPPRPPPIVARPDDLLDDVIHAMVTRGDDAAVVMDGPNVVGIFTLTDTAKVLDAVLYRQSNDFGKKQH